MQAIFGSDGEWVRQLPNILSACAERWSLVIGERLAGGLVGYVFACDTQSGEPAVLKLNPPSSVSFAGTTEQQACALGAWQGRGAVELLDVALDLGALLTRRAVPGTSLAGVDEEEAVRCVATVVVGLFQAPIPSFEFARLEQTLEQYLVNKSHLDSGPEARRDMIEKAHACGRALVATSTGRVLLHGDLMDKNLLRHHERMVAIDPAPCIGDPHSDLGFWAATRCPVQGLESRATELARLVRLDPVRTARWAAVYAVGEACETWRQDILELREWVMSDRARELLRAS